MKNKLILALALLLPLASCTPTTTPEYEPKTDLEKVFQKMKDNNFVVDLNTKFMMHESQVLNQKTTYTSYSIESEGDYGFTGYAQGDDLIYRYSILNNEVVSGAPMINYNNGLRYLSLYEYKKSLQNFDISDLPDEKDADGYYTYPWGKNATNDAIMLDVFHRISSSSYNPESTKIKVVAGTLEINTVVLEYFEDENGEMLKDTIQSFVYDIGNAENEEIKAYIEDGKTAKDPIDNRFFRTINPYLTKENYTLEVDATGMVDDSGKPYTFKATRSIVDDAVLYETASSKSGYLMKDGVAHSYVVANDKVVITETPMADTDGNFYTSFLGGIEPYHFGYLDYSYFVGYKSSTNDNTYVVSESYLISLLSGICLAQVYDEMWADYATIEIIDEVNHDFNIYFDFYNKKTNKQYGRYVAKFRNHGSTTIPVVERYFNKGANPNTQDKDELMKVLGMFKEGNYSIDMVTSRGLTKYYYTENYMMAVPLTSYYKNGNYGFIKENGGIYSFTYDFSLNKMTVDYNVDYSKGDSPMQLPGAGDIFFGSNDVGYISHLTDELYNYDQYVVEYKNGQYYWKNNSTSFSLTMFNYLKTYSNILPTGSGVLVSKGEDPYDTRLTIVSNFITEDGQYTGSYEYTYYDIGNTSVPEIEAYLMNK